MEPIDLPARIDMDLCVILDWHTALPPEANPELLNAMTRGRRSNRGVAQSETSRKRQAFITGMNVYRMSGDEREAKARYMEEWQWRVGYE